ncbi:MAG: hypothetical protein L3J39_05805 [Verrucomicrobiales bacterium]|nr:hypothetical protein [Verrucomicrobiales bacterium]
MKKNHLKLFLIFLASIAIIIPAVNIGKGIYARLLHYSELGWIDIEIPEHFPPVAKVDYTIEMGEKNPVYSISGKKVHLVAGYIGKSCGKVVIDTKNNSNNDYFYRLEMSLSKGNNYQKPTYRITQSGNDQWQIEKHYKFGGSHTYPLDPHTTKIEKIFIH